MPVTRDRRIEVSLDIWSKTLDLAVLRAGCSISGSAQSYDRGDRDPRNGRVREVSMLRIDTGRLDEASVAEQLRALERLFPPSRVREASLPRGSYEVAFNIAVYFHTAMTTVTLSADDIALIGRYEADCEIHAYPAS